MVEVVVSGVGMKSMLTFLGLGWIGICRYVSANQWVCCSAVHSSCFHF